MPFTLPTSTVVSKTSQYTVTVNDQVVLADGTFSVILYTAVGNLGRSVTIKNIGGGTVTVDGNASETIDGNATYSLPTTAAVTLISDGANWRTLTSVTLTANNATYAFGKTEGALNVNNASTANTANNATYAYGKSEANLNVNAAAQLSGALTGLTVNGTISANGYLRADTTNGRMILPVGANKYAT